MRLRSATGAISPFHRTLLIIVAGAFAVRLVYAWAFAPGLTPFGGGTGAGPGGKAGGGHYYVQQYLREQSQTVIEE